MTFFGIIFTHLEFSNLLNKSGEYGFLGWPISSHVNDFFGRRASPATA